MGPEGLLLWTSMPLLLFAIKSSPVTCVHVISPPFQCRAFAKALHYKEMEFEGARSKKMDANPVAVVEALIHINNQLHQHEVFYPFLFSSFGLTMSSMFYPGCHF